MNVVELASSSSAPFRATSRCALALGAAALMLLGLGAADSSLPVDDAYISFSYARTLAAGGGLALTPGVTPVEGFSNPLWVGILAVLARLGAAIPTAGVVLAYLAAAATMLQVAGLTQRLLGDRRWALAAAALFVFSPGVGFHMASGLETLAAALSLVVAFDAFVAGNVRMTPRTSSALLALALLRPEGLLVFAGWALLQREKRASSVAMLVFLVPLGAYVVFRCWYFGQAVPNSVAAKRGLDLVATLAAGRAYLEAFAATHAPVLALAVIGLASSPARLALAVAVPAVVFGAVAMGGAHVEGYPFQRYLFPVLPLAASLAAVGGARVLAVGRRAGLAGAVAATIGLVAVLAAQVVARTPLDRLDGARLREARAAASRWRTPDRGPHDVAYPPYHRLSSWLAERGYAGQTIAMQEIGITAFYSGLDVLDTFGLADAHIARLAGRPSGKADASYVFGQAPHVVAIRLAADGLRPGLLADDVYATDARLAHGYDLSRFFPDATTRLLAVFTRRDALQEVTPLVDRLPVTARLAGPAPSRAGESLPLADPESAPLAAAGRLHFKRWVEGVQWNDATDDGGTSLDIAVPDRGVALFEVSIAAPARVAGGAFVIEVAAPGDAAVEALRVEHPRGTEMAARDLSIDLSPWRGQRVVVTLVHRGGPAEARASGWLVWMEPRLVLLRARPAVRGPTRTPRPELDAAFVEQRVPHTMVSGQAYLVAVTMRNTGRQAWTVEAQHRLGSQRPTDGTGWGIGRVTLAGNERIEPGTQRTFTFTVTAPGHAGTADFQWRMLQEGRTWFGAPSTPITVRVTRRP